MGGRKLVTAEVAARLKIQRKSLVNYILRHEDLKPVEQLPAGDFLWTEEEIQSLELRRKMTKRGPKPKKGKTIEATTTIE